MAFRSMMLLSDPISRYNNAGSHDLRVQICFTLLGLQLVFLFLYRSTRVSLIAVIDTVFTRPLSTIFLIYSSKCCKLMVGGVSVARCYTVRTWRFRTDLTGLLPSPACPCVPQSYHNEQNYHSHNHQHAYSCRNSNQQNIELSGRS